MLGVGSAQGERLRRPLEPLDRVLTDRLQHPVAPTREAEKALVDERLERVEVRATHVLRRAERAPAGEDRESCEELLLALVKEVVGPLDRRAERLLTCFGVPAALQKIEPLREAVEELPRREDARARGCELDGEWEIVEPAAELGDFVRGLEARSRTEELDRLRLGQRRHRELHLPLDA